MIYIKKKKSWTTEWVRGSKYRGCCHEIYLNKRQDAEALETANVQ